MKDERGETESYFDEKARTELVLEESASNGAVKTRAGFCSLREEET